MTGYIFVYFDKSIDGWQLIHRSRGVKALLPGHVREEQLAPLIAMSLNGFIDVEKADKALFEVGDRVKVPVGPFAGFTGTVSGIEAKRLSVLLSVFGRQHEVRIDTKLVRATI